MFTVDLKGGGGVYSGYINVMLTMFTVDLKGVEGCTVLYQ